MYTCFKASYAPIIYLSYRAPIKAPDPTLPMARRHCPNCRKVVDEEVVREGATVIKRCPHCGHVFAKYEVKTAR